MAEAVPARLTSILLVGALRRRAEAAGGFAMVLAKGDSNSGTIMLQCTHRGANIGLFERISDFNGGYRLESCGPPPSAPANELTEYIARRRRSDPDLWLIELDIADGERFAAETIC